MRLVPMLVGGALVAIAPLTVSAQSLPPLGDIARQTEVSRQAVQHPSKTYRDADLAPRLAPDAAPAPSPAAETSSGGQFMSISAGRLVSAEEIIARSQAKVANARKHMDEHYWRTYAAGLRAEVAKAQKDVDVLSTPAERSPQQQALTDKTLARAEKVLADLHERWRKFEDAAHYTNVPKAWLEPPPQQ